MTVRQRNNGLQAEATPQMIAWLVHSSANSLSMGMSALGGRQISSDTDAPSLAVLSRSDSSAVAARAVACNSGVPANRVRLEVATHVCLAAGGEGGRRVAPLARCHACILLTIDPDHLVANLQVQRAGTGPNGCDRNPRACGRDSSSGRGRRKTGFRLRAQGAALQAAWQFWAALTVRQQRPECKARGARRQLHDPHWHLRKFVWGGCPMWHRHRRAAARMTCQQCDGWQQPPVAGVAGVAFTAPIQVLARLNCTVVRAKANQRLSRKTVDGHLREEAGGVPASSSVDQPVLHSLGARSGPA